jgi:transposase
MSENHAVPIQVLLSPAEYRALTKIATRRAVQVHHLVEGLVERALTPMSDVQYAIAHRDLTIRQLHRQGFNDRKIAREIGVSANTVFRTRQRLGLPPNDTRGGWHPHVEKGTS